MEMNDWLTKGISKEDLTVEKALTVLGAKFNLKRIKLGMSREEFAKFLGFPKRCVVKWENGDYDFTVSELIRLCDKLEIDIFE